MLKRSEQYDQHLTHKEDKEKKCHVKLQSQRMHDEVSSGRNKISQLS